MTFRFSPSRDFGFIILFIGIALGMLRQNVFAQENILLHPDKFYKKFFPHMRIKRDPPDSAFVKLYPNYLAVSAHLLFPAIRINLKSTGNSSDNADLKLRTNIDDVVGFSVLYRSVSAGFSFLSKPLMLNRTGYGPTSYHTATIGYGGSLYSFQFKYLKLLGMTDVNNPSGNDRYTKRSDISLKEFHFEGLLNFSWKKYSYQAPLNFSQRQVKSRCGILMKAGLHYSQLSGDSSLAGNGKHLYSQDGNNIQGIRSFSIRLAPGMGGTKVIKRRFYASAAIFINNELLFYRYIVSDSTTSRRAEKFVIGIEGYASVGFQSKRFYIGMKYEASRTQAMLRGVQSSTFYTYAGIDAGYRFNTPAIIRKFYKKTMPPGL